MKVVTVSGYRRIRKNIAGRKTVLAGGCFDIFHYGHLVFLKKAKEQGDMLVIALESDKFIQKKKKRTPLHNQKQRSEILRELSFIDYIVTLPYLKTDDEYFKLVEIIRPAVIAVTEGDPYIIKKKKQAEKIGAVVIAVSPLIQPFSSSHILNYATFSGSRSAGRI